jgi:hypothetical protein
MSWDGANLSATLGSGLAAGSYQVNIRAEDAAGNWSGVTTTTLVVGVAPTITSAQIWDFNARDLANFTVTTTGNPTPSLTTSGTLPPGITFVDNGNGTGTFSGQASPTNDGIYFVTVTATNSIGTGSKAMYMNVDDAETVPTFVNASSVTENYGTAFSFPVDTTGNPLPTISRDASGNAFPAGISLTDKTDGTAVLSGTGSTKLARGTYTFTLKAKNKNGTGTQVFSLIIQ